MANTDRRIIDDGGKQFIPMNMEGTLGDDNFITMPKLLTLAAIAGSIVAWLALSESSGYTIAARIIGLVVIMFIDSLLFRYIVLEEKLYYKMYEELKAGIVIKAYKFWNIASRQNTGEGIVMTYNDTKLGVIVKVERGVITGKSEDCAEDHFDAVSDFIKELNNRRIKRVAMNIMEPSGKDERLEELDKLCNTTDNNNINRLVELSVSHIKNISNNTLTDAEYYLLYTEDIMEQERFLEDVEACMDVLMGGMFSGYHILGIDGDREINEFAKQINNVEYFNIEEASVKVYNASYNIGGDIKVVEINMTNGKIIHVDARDSTIIREGNDNVMDNILDNKDTAVGVSLDEIESLYQDNTSENKMENNVNSYKDQDEIEL